MKPKPKKADTPVKVYPTKTDREVWSSRLDPAMEALMYKWGALCGLTRKSDILRAYLAQKIAEDSRADQRASGSGLRAM